MLIQNNQVSDLDAPWSRESRSAEGASSGAARKGKVNKRCVGAFEGECRSQAKPRFSKFDGSELRRMPHPGY